MALNDEPEGLMHDLSHSVAGEHRGNVLRAGNGVAHGGRERRIAG